MKCKSFTVLILVILLLFLASYFIPSLKGESSENRTLATFHMVLYPEEDSVVYHDSPVERLDAALSDQFPLRETFVKKYLSIFNNSENMAYSLSRLFVEDEENQYYLRTIGEYVLIEDTGYITVFPHTETMNEEIKQKHIEQIECLHERYPNLKMYVYYVTQAFDTGWFDDYIGTKSADHYQEIVDILPDYVEGDHLVYESLDDYMDIHYKTDHHWNHRGARRGYENIYSMMKADFDMGEIRIPQSENKVSQTYNFVYLGSYGRGLGELYDYGYDDFSFYEFDFPEREMAVINLDTRKEIPVKEIGLYDEYRNGEINRDIGRDHYITMYGTARDAEGTDYEDGVYPFVIRNGEGNGKNLLIVGDSYNRAIRDLLASHFDTTVYFDYRILSKLPIDYIIERYEIDALLISSNTSMWNEEDYLFTFSGEK